MSVGRGIVLAAGWPLVTLLASCAGEGGSGGYGGGAAIAVRTPPAAVAGGGGEGDPLGSHGFDLAAGTGTAFVADVPVAGTLSATAGWRRSGTDVDLYLTDSVCPGLDELVLGGCNVLGRGDGSREGSETATALVEAGRYQVFVLAIGERGDTGSLALALAPTAAPPAASAGPAGQP